MKKNLTADRHLATGRNPTGRHLTGRILSSGWISLFLLLSLQGSSQKIALNAPPDPSVDYAIFLQMMLNDGKYNGVQILSPRTVQMMTSGQLSFLFNEMDNFGLGTADLLLPPTRKWKKMNQIS